MAGQRRRAAGALAARRGGRGKAYDRAHFDRWYRDPRRRVATSTDIQRKARLVVGVAESLLQRQVRSALDVGCGEGNWRAALKAIRPGLDYVGVDSSAYVISRYGRARDITYGTFGTLASVDVGGPFDLVICCDMLQYIPTAELSCGLEAIAGLLGGVAFLEAYTTADEVTGDRRGWVDRTPAHYRRAFRRVGLVSVGMHCWVGDALRGSTAALERA
ncbi:MAG: class I SAM-dependent methyltransferase [Gemmatimonadetes bacterium]|nr:class I SAM-dependent methyltransferase [Gemmatimonadota bacterium]